MLTSKSNGTQYSLRAASAAACVANHSPEHVLRVHERPARAAARASTPTASPTSSSRTSPIASGAASPKVVRACIEDEDFASWAKAATDRALKGIPDTDDVALTGTPMVLVNGIPYVGALDDPEEFSQFVLHDRERRVLQGAATTPTPVADPLDRIAASRPPDRLVALPTWRNW